MVPLVGLGLTVVGLVVAATLESSHVQTTERLLADMPPGHDVQPLEERLEAARIHEQRQAALRAQSGAPTAPVDATAMVAELQANATDAGPGITTTDDAPPFYPGFIQTTYWLGQVGDNWYEVHAGAWASDPTRGVLIVSNSETPPALVQVQAPIGSGVLRIVASHGNALSLTGSNGPLTFNVETRTFN